MKPSEASKATLPKISIVTPSYNQGVFLERTIRSVLAQDYHELEYVIVDGASDDDSVEIIRHHADRIAHWTSEPDEGQADAINKGFAKTTGDVMGWINSDDILLPGALQVVGEVFARYPEIEWITGWTCIVNERDTVVTIRPKAGIFKSLLRAGWYHGRGLGFINQESTFWRRELWEKAGGFIDAKRCYSLDYELWTRFARYTCPVVLNSILGAYRVQPQQKTAAIDKYYAEIGVTLPNAVRILMTPFRALLIPLTWPISSRVIYDERCGSWKFRKGPFFNRL